MAYVYRHVRLDKNIPFYIGIGLREDYFKRANDKSGRNKIWQAIALKTNYDVQILFDNVTDEYAYKKESEFIKLYGRKIDGGILANLTLGGEGQSGMTPWNKGKETSIETKKKQSLKKIGLPSHRKGIKVSKSIMQNAWNARRGVPSWNKGLKVAEEQKERQRGKLAEWYAINRHPMLGKHHDVDTKSKMSKIQKEQYKNGKQVWNKGLVGYRRSLGKNNNRRKPVLCYLGSVLMAEYNSATQAANSNPSFRKAGICKNCNGDTLTHKGFIWKWK